MRLFVWFLILMICCTTMTFAKKGSRVAKKVKKILKGGRRGGRRGSRGGRRKSCFTGSSSVHSKWRGEVAMKDLETGDEILSLCQDGEPCFLPVHLWLHRSDDVSASFLKVEHEHGTIQLTGNHIIFKLDKGNTKTPVWAQSIVVGDKLRIGSKGNSTVLKIREISETGIYSPLISSGEFFVDGVLVSSFAGLPTIRYNTYTSGPINRMIYGHQIGKLVFSQSSRIISGGIVPSSNPVDGDKNLIAKWMEDKVSHKVLEAFQLDLDDVEEQMEVEAGKTSWSAFIIGTVTDKIIGQDIMAKDHI